MRRLWNERKLLLVLNFVVILPDKFSDTLAKFLRAEDTNLNGIGFAPCPALAAVASPIGAVWRCQLAPLGEVSLGLHFLRFHHHLHGSKYATWSAQAIPSWGPTSIPSAAKPSQERSAFSPTQFSLRIFFSFFTLPSLDFFPKYIFSVRLLTVGDCQPSATRARVGARGCSAKRRMPGSGDQKHPAGWVYSHIYKKYFLAKICKTCKLGMRSCLCQN